MIAYADESIRRVGHGLYVIAAVLVPDDRHDECRNAARAAIGRRAARYHWRTEQHPETMLSVLAGLQVRTYAYQRPLAGARQDRARAKCLEALLWDLREHDVSEVIFETRHPAADRRDRLVIASFVRQHVAAADLRYGHGNPRTEPLLWLPDAVAGAVGAALVEGDGRYVDLLGDLLTVHDVRED